MARAYEELCGKRRSRGTNVNASTIPAKRFVGYAVSATYGDAVDLLSVVGVTKVKGVTRHAIEPGRTGEIIDDEGSVVTVETTAVAVAKGDKLTVEASTGKVLTAAPGAGVNAEIVAIAETAVGGAGGEIQARLSRSAMQGA